MQEQPREADVLLKTSDLPAIVIALSGRVK